MIYSTSSFSIGLLNMISGDRTSLIGLSLSSDVLSLLVYLNAVILPTSGGKESAVNLDSVSVTYSLKPALNLYSSMLISDLIFSVKGRANETIVGSDMVKTFCTFMSAIITVKTITSRVRRPPAHDWWVSWPLYVKLSGCPKSSNGRINLRREKPILNIEFS